MRARFISLVVAILLIAGFAALNWSEVIRPSTLWFGPVMAEAPLGAILLALLALVTVIFALSAGAMRTQSLVESRHHFKELEAQRLLADKAEASRFTELRQHMDTQLRELRERDAIAASEFEKSRLESQRELRTQLEQINRTLAAHLNELEHRLESRFERMGVARGPVTDIEPVHADALNEHVAAQQVREQEAHQAQMREEERLREQRMREERERGTVAGDMPAESGWRRWF
jgi:hypothetical protein